MRLRRSILALLFILAPCSVLFTWAGEDDELGMWSEIGIEKSITRNWDMGMDLEYRAQNKSRFSSCLSTSYKLFKGLKLGAGYSFLYTCRPSKLKDKSEGVEGDDVWTSGYNFTPEYWYPRHRFSADATGSIKLWRWLKVSLRERYQITHSKSRNVTKQIYREENAKKIIDWDDEGNDIFDIERTITDEDETSHKPALTDQVLRSRIKFELDKKKCHFSPFISAEAHNSVGVGDHMLLQKVRASVGCGYKFRKKNEVTLSYVATFYMYDIEDNEVVRQDDRRHAVSIGYNYSF